MKRAMKLSSVLILAVSLFAVSCERHDFEGPDGTKQLHEHGHGGHQADDHGHDHEHAPGEEHSHPH